MLYITFKNISLHIQKRRRKREGKKSKRECHQNKEGGRWEMLSYLCEESPPLPVSQLEVGSAVPLDHTDSVDLLQALLVVPANKQN